MPLGIAFAVLVGITLVSSLVAESSWVAVRAPGTVTEVLVIVLAGVKMHIVAEHFMELKSAPAWLRGLMTGWIAGVLAIVILLNAYGMN